MSMTSKERLLAAIHRGVPDRLPVTTHHVMPYFLDKYMGGISSQQFFDYFGMDAIYWYLATKPDTGKGEYYDPLQGEPGFLEARRISSDQWRVYAEELLDPQYKTVRYKFVTPEGTLTMVMQSNEHTTWVVDYLIKRREDIELIGKYVTAPKCDVEAVNEVVDRFGDRGIVRGWLPCFDTYGQGGTWAEACAIAGTEQMIYAAHDDPGWVHEFLSILEERKRVFLRSSSGARFDIMEHGGGAGSSTVISPRLFEKFVIPHDMPLIEEAHLAGQRIAYHTCGGMMPLLELIAGMGPDAMETFTPADMGGDVDLAAAKRRIGDRVCMIGGFDQGHYFSGCTAQETRAAVRRCFEAAGTTGGYILAPSDHFFDAEPDLIMAYADEARTCGMGYPS
jgi:uroporphyrinogen decarboxylase